MNRVGNISCDDVLNLVDKNELTDLYNLIKSKVFQYILNILNLTLQFDIYLFIFKK